MNLNERCNNFAVAHYIPIPKDKFIKAEFAMSNSACHYNAVAAVHGGRADKVWLVWAGGKNGVVHFINSKSGKFFDETWNDYDSCRDYRIIREIKLSEFDDVFDVLCATKRALISSCGTLRDKFNHRNKLHGVI